MRYDDYTRVAGKVLDAFLDNMAYWSERADLAEGLTEEEIEVVSDYIAKQMVPKIRRNSIELKRYEADPVIVIKREEVSEKVSKVSEETLDSVTETVHEEVKVAEIPVSENGEVIFVMSDGQRKTFKTKAAAKGFLTKQLKKADPESIEYGDYVSLFESMSRENGLVFVA